MRAVINVVPRVIIPIWPICVVAVVLTVSLLVQSCIHHEVQDAATVWQGDCLFKSWHEGDSGLAMVVSCGEQGVFTLRDGQAIRSYILNSGPLGCSLSAAGDIDCENRPPPEG